MTQPGRRRIGRFEILEALGSGAMGVVYRARDTRLEREVAVKVLAEGLAADSEMVRRFEQEARAASSLNHPNIVTVFDAGVDGQTGYIVTELLQGSTLRHRIAGRRLPLEFVLDVGVQIAAGLSAAHAAGLVHRDIKPENIFVTHDGAVKLLDFGIARLIQTDEAPIDGETATMDSGTRDGVIVGTPAYMAPEQIRGHTVDARTDLFAVGCVLYEMLFGVGPFNRPNRADAMAAALAEPAPRAPDASVPAIVDRIVRRCLEKVPAARFQSAADLRFALETASDPALAPAGPSSRRANAPRWLVPALIALSAALGAALLVSNRARPAIVDAGLNGTGPVVIDASTVVPASERPIAPAISPDGKWVTYIGLAGGSPGLYVQFVNGGPPVRMAQDADIPLQNRTNVGGIDVLPDGSGIVVSGRPRPVGLWQVPGIWIVPAPFGGPPRRLTERYASVRWSPDGQQMAAVIANPLVGDAVAVAGADGQDERVIVPASRGLHLHQVAWGHDGRYVYYSQTLEPNHALGEIYRAPAAGGAPEVVVQTQGTAMFPALTPDGRALIYAGDHAGHGLNIWWRPLDGSPERRLTTGAGEFTEPFISRNGRHLVMLARRRRGQLVRINAAEASSRRSSHSPWPARSTAIRRCVSALAGSSGHRSTAAGARSGRPPVMDEVRCRSRPDRTTTAGPRSRPTAVRSRSSRRATADAASGWCLPKAERRVQSCRPT